MRKVVPKKDSYAIGGIGPSLKKGESKPIYPTIRIDLTHLPEAKNWKVGNEYNLELELKMVGLSQGRFDNNAEFEIHGIETESSGEEAKESASENESEAGE